MPDFDMITINPDGIALLVNSLAALTIENENLRASENENLRASDSKASKKLLAAKSDANYWQERALKSEADWRVDKDKSARLQKSIDELNELVTTTAHELAAAKADVSNLKKITKDQERTIAELEGFIW